jgi:hypothetical protein
MNPDKKREELYEVVQKAFFDSKNKEELKNNLMKLSVKHDAGKWIDFENLRKHYQTEFRKIQARV